MLLFWLFLNLLQLRFSGRCIDLYTNTKFPQLAKQLIFQAKGNPGQIMASRVDIERHFDWQMSVIHGTHLIP